MELIVSAVAGDLVNRFISFMINRYHDEENLDEKMEKLQELLIRVHMVVEEADVRYITNSKMLLQLKKLVQAMYRGYHILESVKYRALFTSSSRTEIKVSSSRFQDSFRTCISRLRTSNNHDELHSTLVNLESVASNLKEFLLLLSGCERMFRTPYDSYLYMDTFMFGRHVEKQQVINFLLQDNNLLPSAPTVLPIIGGSRVGKKTLVAHVCNDEKIRSKFSSILHMNGENIWRMEHGPVITGRSLVVIEFTSDVDDKNWLRFYSSATHQMEAGSKIIIVSRVPKLTRFGTVKPVGLNSLSREEYSYLFRALAFGSTNPEEQPQLASIDLAEVLSGSLVTANVYADMLRRNQNVSFWLSILQKYRNVVQKNLSVFGEHPKNLMDKDHPIDVTRLASSSSSSFPSFATLRLMPPHSEIDDCSKRELPKVMFQDMIAGTAVLPKEEFELVAWESRIPPYKRFVNLVTTTYCDEGEASRNNAELPSNKRQRLEV